MNNTKLPYGLKPYEIGFLILLGLAFHYAGAEFRGSSLPLVPADYRSEGIARLALYDRAPNADALVAQVPQALHVDPGLIFDVVHWERHNDQYDAAAQLLLSHPDNPVRPAAWAGGEP